MVISHHNQNHAIYILKSFARRHLLQVLTQEMTLASLDVHNNHWENCGDAGVSQGQGVEEEVYVLPVSLLGPFALLRWKSRIGNE
jgi:hypothetical protein